MTKTSDSYDIAKIVADAPWFQNIPKEGREKLIQASHIKHFTARQYLYQVGETTASIYCLLSGRLRISMTSELGQAFAVTDLEPPNWLGDFSLLPEESRIQEAQIQVAADILLIPRSAVLEVGDKYPVLYRNLFVDAGQRSRKMYELMAAIMFYPLRARLAARLINLLTQHGVVVDNGVRLAIKLSQNDFASLCLGSRQRVNKIFREWTEQGILAMQDDYYVIFDLDALKTEINVQEL